MSGAFCSSVSFNVYSSTKVPGSWDTAQTSCLIISSWYLRTPSKCLKRFRRVFMVSSWRLVFLLTAVRCARNPLLSAILSLSHGAFTIRSDSSPTTCTANRNVRVKMFLAFKKKTWFMGLCHFCRVFSIPLEDGHYCVIPKSQRSKSCGRLGICLHTRIDKPAMPRVTQHVEQKQQS